MKVGESMLNGGSMNSSSCATIPLIVGWCTGLCPWNIPGGQGCPTGPGVAPSAEPLPVGHPVMPAGELLAAGPWIIPDGQDCPAYLGVAPSAESLPVGHQVIPAVDLEAGPWIITAGIGSAEGPKFITAFEEEGAGYGILNRA